MNAQLVGKRHARALNSRPDMVLDKCFRFQSSGLNKCRQHSPQAAARVVNYVCRAFIIRR